MYHLSNYARATPEATAVIFEPSGRRFNFLELEHRANKAANALIELGLRAGDCLVICIENSPELLDLTLGAQRVGLYYVLVSTKFSKSDFDYIVADSGAKLAVVSKNTEAGGQLAQDVGSEACVVLAVNWTEWLDDTWEQHFSRAPTTLPLAAAPGREMLYTSGTTGRPKGVRKPAFSGAYDQVDSRNATAARAAGLGPGAVYLSTSPLYHAAPNRYLSAAIHGGATSVVMEHFDAELALGLIERYRCTHSVWVPTMFHRMLRLPEEVRGKYDLRSMKVAVHGAAPCPVHVKESMIAWWGPVLYEYYSGTEGIGATSITSTEWLKHKGSVGKANDGIIHILDEHFVEVAPRTIGKVFFESQAAFEYWNAPAKTDSILSSQGWRSFGDVGYVDEEGYLYLTDREDFTINTGGVKVYPQEVENMLLAHPQVVDAAVFGLPHDEFGEQVVAVVELPSYVEPSDDLAKSLRSYCRLTLGPVKAPKVVYFSDDFPRHPTGKLYKKSLRERFLTQLSQ